MRSLLSVVLLASFLMGCSEPPPPPTFLRVTSQPEGAEVLINGEPRGYAPLTITDLPAGAHHLILLLDDYVRLTQRITVKGDEATRLDLVLEHETGILSIESEPEGAQVYLRDISLEEESEAVLLGETPLERVKVDTGAYSIELRLKDYHPITKDLAVKARSIQFLEHPLKAMTAYIQLYSVPTGAQIWINDELNPNTTPAKLSLLPGEYTIGVYAPGYNMDERVFTIVPNGQHQFETALQKGDMPLGMVLIPAGEFIFGADNKSPDERPKKQLHLDAFYMDKYEVTNAEFKEVFPSHTIGENQELYPVKGVTWKQAAEYAAAVDKRLPTEMEWEKVARGTQGLEFPWGGVFEEGRANTSEAGSVTTMKVGTFKKGVSKYGCYDLSGNVYEWTSTWYNPYPGNPEVSVEYGRVYRVLRGGSYLTDAFESRSARRHYSKPDDGREDFGFRCAKSLSQ